MCVQWINVYHVKWKYTVHAWNLVMGILCFEVAKETFCEIQAACLVVGGVQLAKGVDAVSLTLTGQYFGSTSLN